MSETITARVQTAADDARLGERRQHYHGGFRLSVIAVIAMAALFSVVIPGSFLIGPSWDIGVLLLLIGLPFLAVALWLWRWEHGHSNDDLYRFDAGLVHVDRRGAVTAYPWAAVSQVQARKLEVSIQNIPVRNVFFIKVVHDDGAVVVLNNRFRGVEALGATVQESTASARLPAALDALRSGGTLNFDRVVIDGRGIRHRGRTLAWPTIVALGASEGIVSTKVTIKTRSRRRPYTRWLFPSRPFPNQLLLISIARVLGVDSRETATPPATA